MCVANNDSVSKGGGTSVNFIRYKVSVGRLNNPIHSFTLMELLSRRLWRDAASSSFNGLEE